MPFPISNKLSIKLVFILFCLLFSLLVFSISILFKITSEYKAIETNWIPSVKITKDLRDSLIFLKYSHDLYLITNDEKYKNLLEYRKVRINDLLAEYKGLVSSKSERVIYNRFKKSYEYFIRCEINLAENCYNSYVDIEDFIFYQALNETKELLKINEEQMGLQLSSSSSIIYRYKNILTISIFSVLFLLLLAFLLFIREKLKGKKTVPHRIINGLDSGFNLVYQPIVDIKSKEVIGVEVLSRFEDKYGIITPDDFIPIIKSLGLSWEFSKRVISATHKEFNSLKGLNPNFKISINIFPTDLEKNILNVLNMKYINEIDCNIVFEITEFEGCDNEKVQENIKILKEVGYTFSIDDFGTGYSNFNTLKDFDISSLKIDRSLLFDIEDDPIKIVLLKNICEMAKTLSLNVIAEGIENLNQHNIISKSGVKFAQGWLYGKPVNISCLSEILTKENSVIR
ncbi:EAL domain-containing protein [Vibrio parahaemolyticus]